MWLRNLYRSEWPLADQLPRSTMSKAVSKLQAESKKIVKYGKDSKSLQQQVQFKEKIFVVPCVGKVESRVEQEGVHEQRDRAVEVAVEVSKQELMQKDDCAAKKSARNLKLKVKRRDSEIQDLRETMHAHEKQVEQLDYEFSSSLVDGSARPFPDAVLKVDSMFDSLVTPHNNDGLTQTILQILCTTFAMYSERLLADHMEGGRYAEPSASLRTEVASVPKTNRVSEADFRQLDRLLREKPNASLIALEGTMLFANNKSADWLRAKSQKERDAIITSARQLATSHRAQYKARLATIQETRLALLKEKN